MKEDCATGMSASHGCNDDRVVIDQFKEALKARIGSDRFRLWFVQGVEVEVELAAGSGEVLCVMSNSGPSNSGPSDSELADQATSNQVTSNQGANSGTVVLNVRGQFAADRMKANFMQELRAAAMHCGNGRMNVRIDVQSQPVQQPLMSVDSSSENGASDDATEVSVSVTPGACGPATEEPVGHSDSEASSKRGRANPSRRDSSKPSRRSPDAKKSGAQKKSRTQSIASLLDFGERDATRMEACEKRKHQESAFASMGSAPKELPQQKEETVCPAGSDPSGDPSVATTVLTMANFVGASSNQLAHAAAKMACQVPGSATPLFFYGPTGVGKTHLVHALADHFRRRHRMRRVVHLSAEHFTNDFIRSVGTSGLTAFRKRYRDVDALLIDDVQFVAAKKATLRELLYTIETLIAAGRPLIFTANRSPSEITGLSGELVGRMAAGLVCPILPHCTTIRTAMLEQLIQERCPIAWADSMVEEIAELVDGDGRLISGVVNLVGTLQRMFQRMPTMEEIRQFGGDMLRSQAPTVTLRSIERAVCRAFDLDESSLQGSVQTRSVSEPRMLAMYLSRQKTSSAFSEIAKHYGGRSHSTAIAATKKVDAWIEQGKAIGRGPKAMSARQAVERIEQILRTG
ncbi:MAG: DnaA/Hda family protein [Planctomycetota bacterium]